MKNGEAESVRQRPIVRVAEVTEMPRIADVLVDPVRLWQENCLSIANHDLLVRSGKSEEMR